jgi:hypothetical protein
MDHKNLDEFLKICFNWLLSSLLLDTMIDFEFNNDFKWFLTIIEEGVEKYYKQPLLNCVIKIVLE